ncbi:type II and III secretion system family protein [Micavibrio aeruginosavorus]|uniref:type II and III secretion system family protein n=1 Tax=Micavibrio aeruginosavorus TaxID=349221 RepID=UPI003F4ABB9A
MPVHSRTLRSFGRLSMMVVGTSATALMLGGCDLTRNHLKADRSTNMEFQDYRDALAPRIEEESEEAKAAKTAQNNIPDLMPYVAAPSKNLKPMPLVSISVNQTVPLRDALYQLAEQAGYDLELDPNITGSVIFTARERPLDSVIERISEIAGLRYSFDDDVMRVELDKPYHKTYKIDYLSYIRKSESGISNDISVVSGGTASTGSKFAASSSSEADFWGELSTNLQQILGVTTTASSLMTASDPTITAAASNPAPVAPATTTDADGNPVVQVQAPQAVLNVTSLPTTTTDPNSGMSAGTGGGDEPSFAMNKQGGIVSIYANDRQHAQIRDYLNELRSAVTAQVLIEAKILEVSLNDEYAVGIDWSLLEGMIGEFSLGFDVTAAGGLIRPDFSDPTSPVSNFVMGYAGNDIEAVVQAVSRFGTVRALSSPRLTVLNNQSAVLNVADNRVYFELDIDVTTQDNNTQTTIDSEIKSVPEGVLINVIPSIDTETKTISMAVRPTVTRIVDQIPDPAVAFTVANNALATNVQSLIPVVNIQEMDSVVRAQSGQALIMGGLMEDRTQSTQQGVPVLSEIPLFGAAFRNQVDNIQKTELVIFLKATIIDGSGISPVDRDLYRSFSGDRRPVDM